MPDRQYQPANFPFDDLVCPDCRTGVPKGQEQSHDEYHDRLDADQRHRERLGRFNPAIEHKGASL